MAEKYLAYPEYKGSDVGWLKQVPKHWKKITFKYLLEMIVDNRGRTPPTYDVGIPLLEAKQIDGSLKYTGTSFDKFINEAGHSGFIRNDVKENDILFITVGTIGKTCLVPNQPDFVIAQNLVALRMIDNYSPVFMLYWLRSMAARESMLATNKDSILDSIKISDFIQSRLYIPELYEQTQIANFLDHETAQIDTLIDKQQTLIQLLKEKRQAVISHAVTKGLNPDAPMKDSGVEWLGGIPSHWNMQKLKYVGEAKNGLTYSPDNVTEAGIGTLVLRSSNIQNAQLSFEDNVYVDMKIPERILVRTDDILICSRNGSRRLIGKNALITEDVAGQAFGAFMVVFRSEINTYLYWILNSPLFEYQSGSFLTSTINQLTIGNLHSMEIPIPPKKEQDEIEKYLKTKMIDFDKLISKAEQAIQLMQERRTALISAAVTGKIDVRGWRASE